MWPIVQHALSCGLVLSGILSVTLLGILFVNPEILLKDYPPDIQAKYGPMSARAKRQRLLVAIFH